MEGDNLPAVPEVSERDRLPAIIERLGDMPAGKTVFHKHADGKEVWQLLCLLRLDQRAGKKVSLREALNIEWPDLVFSDKALDWFVEHYVDPMVVVPEGFYRKGLMQADANLNHVERIATLAKKMEESWDDMRKKQDKVLDYDGDGDPIMGPTSAEVIAAGERVIKAYEKQGEAAASVGMAPKKEKGGINLNLGTGAPTFNVNLGAAVGNGFVPPKDAIDAEGKQKA